MSDDADQRALLTHFIFCFLGSIRSFAQDKLHHVDILAEEAIRIRMFLQHIDRLETSLPELRDKLTPTLLASVQSALFASFNLGLLTITNPNDAIRLRRRQAEPARKVRTARKNQRAERVRLIIESAKRKPDGSLKFSGAVRAAVARKLGIQDIDRKTLKGYVDYVDKNGRTDIIPDEEREK